MWLVRGKGAGASKYNYIFQESHSKIKFACKWINAFSIDWWWFDFSFASQLEYFFLNIISNSWKQFVSPTIFFNYYFQKYFQIIVGILFWRILFFNFQTFFGEFDIFKEVVWIFHFLWKLAFFFSFVFRLGSILIQGNKKLISSYRLDLFKKAKAEDWSKRPL